MTSFTRTTLGVALILLITFCATFIFSRLTERWGGVDLTEGDVYTLSDGSRNIVANIDRPLTMHLFYAKEAADSTGHDQFQQFHNYFFYVRDLLRAYERASEGRIELREYDPRPFSDESEEADRLGIQGFPITETERYYFGLAITSGSGAKEVIPFFDPSPNAQAQLEYKVSELIESASRREKTRLGVLSSLSIAGSNVSPFVAQMMARQGKPVEQPWLTIERLRKLYDVEELQADVDEIPSDLDYLMVVHPKQLGDEALYAIDQFVMRGGRLLAFVDPHTIFADPPPQQPNNPFGGSQHDASSSLNRLTKAWGIELEEGKFLGDANLAQRLQSRAGVVRFPGAPEFTGATLAKGVGITEGLEAIGTTFPGVLREVDGVENEVRPLITTTSQGGTWTASSFELGGPMGIDLQKLAAKFSPGGEELWFAAIATGELQSAFPEGRPGEPASADESEAESEDEADEPESDEHLAKSQGDSVVVVVADVDMITDNGAWGRSLFGMEPANSNVAFVSNTLDYIAGSTDLIAVRARKQFRRPFTVVDDIEREADAATAKRQEAINREIEGFRSEIASLNQQATGENVGLLQNEAFTRQRELEANLRAKERELRDVQKSKLDEIEALGSTIKNANIFGVPALVALVGVALFVSRSKQRKAQVRGGAA